MALPVPEAAGFCVSKQQTSSPRCIRKASRRWRHSSSNWSRSASISYSPPTRSLAPWSERVMRLKVNLAHPACRVRCSHRSGSRLPPGSGGPRPARGRGWLLPGRSVAQELHEHQGLVQVAHAHALGDGVAQALVGGGGSWRHGGLRGGGPCGGEALRRCHALLHPLGYTWRSSYRAPRKISASQSFCGHEEAASQAA